MMHENSTSEAYRYLHPLSLVFEVGNIIRANLIPTIAAVVSTSRGGWIGSTIGFSVIAVFLAFSILRYFTFRYAIVHGELVVDTGLIFKSHRRIPLERVQNIDLSQNIFQRLLKVGEMRVETAAGGEPEAVMRVVALSEHQRLRNDLFAFRSNMGRAEGSPVSAFAAANPSAPSEFASSESELILSLPPRLVFWAGMLSNRGGVIAGLIIGVLWQWKFGNFDVPWMSWGNSVASNASKHKFPVRDFIKENIGLQSYIDSVREHYGALGSIALFLVALLVLFLVLRLLSAIWYVTRFYGYRLERHKDSLHVQCGLLTQVSATIPLGRIQFISVQEPWLHRQFGLASIRIETAGGGGEESEEAVTSIGRKWFVPVVEQRDVGRILRVLDPRIENLDNSVQWQPLAPRAQDRMFRPIVVFAILCGIGIGIFSLEAGIAAAVAMIGLGWWYVRKKSKSKKFGRTSWGVVYKSGTLYRKVSMTFFEKIQSLSLRQSPFDKRWQMGVIDIDTAAAGPADHRIQVELLDAEVASREFALIRQRVGLSS